MSLIGTLLRICTLVTLRKDRGKLMNYSYLTHNSHPQKTSDIHHYHMVKMHGLDPSHQ